MPKQKRFSHNWGKLLQAFVVYLFIALAALFFLFRLAIPTEEIQRVQLSQLVEEVKGEKVQKITVTGDKLDIIYKDGQRAVSRKESAESLLSLLFQSGVEDVEEKVEIEVLAPTPFISFGDIVNILSFILVVLFFVMIFRQSQRAAGSIFSFGKSAARRFTRDEPRKNFKDAAGVSEAIQELQEVVDFLRNPGKYLRLGARIPKGVLLVGASGTGKTLLARAVAGEANVPFFSVAGSEFMEMLVGVGASRVRDLFSMAKRSAPAIIFIDELESIGRQRGLGFSGGQGEQEQTLNQILVEMDGFTPNDNVIVLAASNRPDLLDPALTRPGRFDRRVVLQMPDIEGRKGILKIHMQGKPISSEVDIEVLARRTVGFSGADIENMLNEAAIFAARKGRKSIDGSDLEEAATKVKLGPERRRLQSEEEKKLTAYHEAGHALVASMLPHMDPVHRVSIVARGLALGFTMIPPKIDRYNQTQTQLLETITALMGGRAAEKMSFNEMTIGAASDLKQATKLAYEMVTEYGMSELGPMSFTISRFEEGWSSHFWEEGQRYSEKSMSQIDSEVKKIVDKCFAHAEKILQNNEKRLKRVAEELFEKETLEGEEFKALVQEE